MSWRDGGLRQGGGRGLKSGLLELTAIGRERRIVPHSLAGWFAVGMCAVFVVELVVVAAYAVWLISHLA